jgi:hypothetical protein
MILRVSRRSSALCSLRGVFVAAWPDCNIFGDLFEISGKSKPSAIGNPKPGVAARHHPLTSHRAQMQQRRNPEPRASA